MTSGTRKLFPLITVRELEEAQRVDPELVILDARWTLGKTDGRDRFLEAHIPGAQFADLDLQLATAPSAAQGRHPLPTREAFRDTLRSFGVTRTSTIVVYDQAQSFGAARLWWLLRNAGLEPRVLDGGLRAWLEAGLPTVAGDAEPAPESDIDIDWGILPTLTIDEAAAFPRGGILLDARAGERYRGEVEPLDPRAGHIPGALSSPTTDNLSESGAFLPIDRLRARFVDLGIDDDTVVAAYCGSGITASHEILALEVAGFSAALFPGSWSQWSRDPAREVAVGDEPTHP